MFENAVAQDPGFALAYAAIANVCAQYHYNYERKKSLARALARGLAEGRRAAAAAARGEGRAGLDPLHRRASTARRVHVAQEAIERKRDTEGAYYLMLRALFAAGRYQEVAAVAEAAIEASGTDYNVYVPITNALDALGKKDALAQMRQREIQALEAPHQDRARGRARAAAAGGRLRRDRPHRGRDARGQPRHRAAAQRGDACSTTRPASSASSARRPRRMAALKKAWDAGFIDPDWARRDPDLALLHGDPEFERLYPTDAGRA